MDHVQPKSFELKAGSHERLDNIDALRALAVVAVMLTHYTVRYAPDYLGYAQPVWPAVYYGDNGVQLFFIISGYCIYMTAMRCPGVAEFWIRRITRLQPAYMAAILITFATVSLFGLPGREVSASSALGNMIWLNAFHLTPSVDGVYWSLIVELKLYILFGLVFFGLKNRIDPILCWSIFGFAGCAVSVFDDMMAGSLIDRYTFSLATFVFPFSGFFLLGMLIYRWSSTPFWIKSLAIAFFLISCLNAARNLVDLAVLVSMFPLATLVLGWKTMRVPSAILFVGFVSYPLYLLHNNVGIVVIRETAQLIPSAHGRIALAIAISLALAAFLSFTIEHRFRKRLERFLETALEMLRFGKRQPRQDAV